MKMLFKSPRLWWKFEGRYYHKDLYRGVKNLIKWFPVVWKDRDWDHRYIFDILEHKLKSQAKYIGDRDIHVSAKRDAEIMLTCVKLMERVRDEFYQMEYQDYHQTKYWFEDIKDKPGYSTWESELQSENFDEYFKKYPLVYKRVLKGEGIFNIDNRDSGEETKQVIAMNIGHINHDRARKLLFKIMEENIEKWWD
jgi:hypothetical protein